MDAPPTTQGQASPPPPQQQPQPQSPSPLQPQLRVAIAADLLQAHVLASPRPTGPPPAGWSVDRAGVVEQLERAGVVFGLLEPELARVVITLSAQRHLPETILVASGQAPVPPSLQGPQLLVPALVLAPQVESLRALAKPHYQDVVETAGVPTPGPVAAGTVLAGYTISVPGSPGIGVTGAAIPVPAPALDRGLGPGAVFDAGGLVAKAVRPGVPWYDGTVLDVLAVGLDGTVEVQVAEDGQSASVTLTPPGPGGQPLTAELVGKALAAAGVRMGINRTALDEAVAEVAGAGSRITRPVAEGRLPKDGYDAQLQYLVDLKLANVPLEERGGRVDFKGISIICPVSAGQGLVKRWPGAKGVPGYTVQGKILPAYNGRELRLPRGRNVMPHQDDPDLLTAKISGHVRSADGGLEVQECFAVNGDVDYSTGHITFERTVYVKGDVKSGFNLDVGGDLEVGGLIEDCMVRVGGNVLIRRGFVGNGQGVVHAGGNVMIAFGRNQTVRASGTVTFEREAINMNAVSRQAVLVNGLLVGGKTVARNRVACKVLGNSGGTRTEIEVGVDHHLLAQRAQLEEDLKRLRKLQARGMGGGGEPVRLSVVAAQDEEAVGRMGPAEIDQLIEALEDRRGRMLDEAYAGETASLVVHERVFPGVWIRVGNSPQLKIGEYLTGPVTFVLREGEIRWA